MIVDFEGRSWTVDPGSISFKHALVIQDYTGLSIADWEDSLDLKQDADGNLVNPPPRWLKSVGALYWLMLAQNGGAPPIDGIDFDFQAFLAAFFRAVIAEAKAAAPDPTQPSPTTLSPPADQASPEPATQTATTPLRPVPREGAAIAS